MFLLRVCLQECNAQFSLFLHVCFYPSPSSRSGLAAEFASCGRRCTKLRCGVSARAAPFRSVCVCGAYGICQRPGRRHLVRSGASSRLETSTTPCVHVIFLVFLNIFFERCFNGTKDVDKTINIMLNKYCVAGGISVTSNKK